ncbi:MAG TPA: beta-ketoacyl-ACP synthase II [Myxococcota bacterium]|nr:beta-ketoacyl-ACP synthase II [Myxococcota bacterium]
MPRPASGRSVVVTGLGCVSPLGATADETWSAAIAGRSGVSRNRRFDTAGYSVTIAAQAPDDFDCGDLPGKEARRLDRFTLLAVAAAREALEHAKLDAASAPAERFGVAIGSGIGGLQTLSDSIVALHTSGPRRVSPFTIPMSICNMASGYVAIRHGLRGPNLCQTAACASGAHSIGEAARAIERGDADLMLAGGAEAPITGIGVAGFANMKALSTRNDDPAAASRPFDLDRDGFVVGEGAAVLVLESLEGARARGASILAHVLGYGMTADAAGVAQPTEDGEGAQRCMRLAIEDAGLGPRDVDHLNAHATSTPQGDTSEARAIRAVFGDHTDRVAVSATKSMTGHLLGAAGAVEALFCVRALQTGILPPTINLERPDPACELDHVANKAREVRVRVALSNSFGFGGTNASLVFGRAD